jgi:hypothetical protein
VAEASADNSADENREVIAALYLGFRSRFLCCSGDNMTNCTNSQCKHGLLGASVFG